MRRQKGSWFWILAISLLTEVLCRAQGGLMVTSVAAFNGTNGIEPVGELVQRQDGLLYGVTGGGGGFGQGTVYKTSLEGSLTTLFSFNGTNGSFPTMSPLIMPDGSSYGTTLIGGPSFDGATNAGYGTIFKMDSNNVVSTVFSFSLTNGDFPACLTLATDGNLYGTTFYGGVFTNDIGGGITGYGTAFKITTNGDFTLLTSFNGTNGFVPRSLVQAADGNFYGITQIGGSANYGTVFRMTTNGDVTTLYSFVGTNGMDPIAPLTLGKDGYLYGTTFSGGDCGGGIVFRISTNGEVKTLASFCGELNGSSPQDKLIEITNGLFYGTAYLGGNGQVGNANGTMFQITTNGELTDLVTFRRSLELPYRPVSGVIKASDGNYYGGAEQGGVFCVCPIEAPVLKPSLQGDQMSLSWKAWAGYRYSVISHTNVTLPLVNWTDPPLSWNLLSQQIAPTNGPMSFSDPIVPEDVQRFYLVVFSQVL